MNQKLKELLEKYPENKKVTYIKSQCPEGYQELLNLTNFLDSNVSDKQRIWHLHNQIYCIPKCIKCDNLVKWNKKISNYNVTCSTSCSLTGAASYKINKEKKYNDKCLNLLDINYKEVLNITNFLSSETVLENRVWHVQNNVFQIPKCVCENNLKWNLNKNTYNSLCSKCLPKSDMKKYKSLKTRCFNTYNLDYDFVLDKTNFLANDALLINRIWHVQNNVFQIPKCVCGNNLKWDNSKDNYGIFCSTNCASKSLLPKYKNLKTKCKINYNLDYDDVYNFTSFLSDNTLLSCRVWHFENKIIDIPKCKVCYKSTNWQSSIHNYSTTCYGQCTALYNTSKKMFNMDYNTLVNETKFLPVDVTIKQRYWHFKNNINTIPECIVCDNKVSFNEGTQKYRNFCSIKCEKNSNGVKNKKIYKRLNNWRIFLPLIDDNSITEIKNIIKTIPLGMETTFFRKNYPQEYRNLIELTKYLSENAKDRQRFWHLENDIKEIPKCECGNFIGWDSTKHRYPKWCKIACKNKSEEYKQKVKESNISKYGTPSYTSSKDFREKYKNTMIANYGVDHFLKDSNNIKYIQNIAIKKHGRLFQQLNKTDFALQKINDKNWLYEQHITNKMPLKIIGKLLGYDKKIVSQKMKQFNIPINRYIASYAQKEIQEFLTNNNIEFISNTRNIIKPYELDIYMPKLNLAIEYCGVYWHSEINVDKNYHKNKLNLCKEQNIRLLTIFEDEWIYNRKLVEEKLLSILGVNNKISIYARKCKIKIISNDTKTKFFNDTHIQGDGPSSINIGLEYNNELVACLGFIDTKNKTYTLNRYATSCNVPGGFSKLLRFFEKTYNPKQIITFADLRWSNGNLYYQTGFELNKILKPDYMYAKGEKREHKFNFRHKYLKNKLKNYNPNLSEHENCINNFYYRIYDCGKLRFIKKY